MLSGDLPRAMSQMAIELKETVPLTYLDDDKQKEENKKITFRCPDTVLKC